MPRSLVFVTVKPLIVIQLRPETRNPSACPLRVTVAPEAAVKTMGALDVPDVETLTFSGYVPAATCTVWPAATTCAAAPIVQNGRSIAPEPESVQEELPRST